MSLAVFTLLVFQIALTAAAAAAFPLIQGQCPADPKQIPKGTHAKGQISEAIDAPCIAYNLGDFNGSGSGGWGAGLI